MFYLSFIFALLMSISSTFFCVAAGEGAVLDLLGACSVILLIIGTLLSSSALKLGSVLSMFGVGACTVLVLLGITELIRAIPFRQQPGQVSLLYVPFIFLGLLMLHLAYIRGRLRKA